MNILSLFDGISCAKVSLDRCGINVKKYYASEVDKYAIQVSQKNHPDIEQIGDITKVYPHNSSDIDLVIGGSPCQDLSIAKKNREGLEGKMSGLFYEYLRVVTQARPKYFILENVSSMPKEARETITNKLWGIEPITINASLVSAQSRKRLFWVGKRKSDGGYQAIKVQQPVDKKIYLMDILDESVSGEYYIKLNEGKAPNGKKIEIDYNIAPHSFKETRTNKGKEFRKAYRKKTGKDMSLRGKEYKKYSAQTNRKSNCLTTSLGYDGLVFVGGIKSKDWVGDNKKLSRNYSQGNRIYSSNGKSSTLSANSGGIGGKTGLYSTRSGIRKLTPVECERLQGLPDNYTEGISNTQRYKCIGNAFNVDVVSHILKQIF